MITTAIKLTADGDDIVLLFQLKAFKTKTKKIDLCKINIRPRSSVGAEFGLHL